MMKIFQKFFYCFYGIYTQRAVILKTARKGGGLHGVAVMKARRN